MEKERFIGTWKLVDFRLTASDGAVTRPYGDGAKGLLIYTADGFMSAATAFPDGKGGMRPLFYSGPFDALEDRNIHHIELSDDPALVGSDQVRLVSFEGDRLVLTASPSIAGGPGTSADIAWERAT